MNFAITWTSAFWPRIAFSGLNAVILALQAIIATLAYAAPTVTTNNPLPRSLLAFSDDVTCLIFVQRINKKDFSTSVSNRWGNPTVQI